MEDGWVRLHRKVLNSTLWDLTGDQFRIAAYLILEANHKPASWRGIKIKRGQLVRSIRSIADDCDRSTRTVQDALRVLEGADFLTRIQAQGVSLITICKYGKWQSGVAVSVADGVVDTATESATPSATEQEGKKEKKTRSTPCSPPSGEILALMSQEKYRSLNTPDFSEAWSDFIQHRQELKGGKVPLTERSATMALNKFLKWGQEDSIEAIQNSIIGDYQGIFKPNGAKHTETAKKESTTFRIKSRTDKP